MHKRKTTTFFKDKKKFLESLSKKRVSAGALFFDSGNRLLMVKPNYKDHWSIPGGVIDKNETPLQGCIREVEEEIGLKVKDLKLIACVYAYQKEYDDECMHFVFTGGILTRAQIEKITICAHELEGYKFVNIKDINKYNSHFKTEIIKDTNPKNKKDQITYYEETR